MNRNPSTDFGNREWNLLVPKVWFAMEICEICALGCKLAQQPPVGDTDGAHSSSDSEQVTATFFTLFNFLKRKRLVSLIITCLHSLVGILMSLYYTYAVLLFIPYNTIISAAV
jgi:hypothetical protein